MIRRRPPQNQNWHPPYGYYNGPGYYQGQPQIRRKKTAAKSKRSDHMTWRGIYYTFIAALLLAAVLVAGIWVYVQLGGGAK